ncbi:Flp family type IVb pilin [Marmoricola sp. RAF53]|uniref:Flp family type IVb pilin n=1 Tax=Marmoricola sp. RAF53 TaxID=3233059 RepID=UPI003F95BE54
MAEGVRSPRRRDEGGVSAVEYGLMVVAVAALIIGIVFLLSGAIDDDLSKTCDKVDPSATAGPGQHPATC